MEAMAAPHAEERRCVYACSHVGLVLHPCSCGNVFHHVCAGADGNDDMNNCGRCSAPRPASPQRGGAEDDGADKAPNEDAPESDGDGDSSGEEPNAVSRWDNVNECLLPPDHRARSDVHKFVRCVLRSTCRAAVWCGQRVRCVTDAAYRSAFRGLLLLLR